MYATRGLTVFVPEGHEWTSLEPLQTSGDLLNLADGRLLVTRRAAGIRVAVHNGSEELLPRATVRIVDEGLHTAASSWIEIGAVAPSSSVEKWTLFPDVHGLPRTQGAYSVHLAFRDSSGRWWERHEGDIIQELSDAPTD